MHEYQQKFQHTSSTHHTNSNDRIMSPKLSGQPMKETNSSSHINTLKKCISRIDLLCKRSRPHHAGTIIHSSGSTMKNNRRQQRSGIPFTLLLWHKPIWQVEVPCQKHYILHTQRYIIPVRITVYKSCKRLFFLGHQNFNNTRNSSRDMLTLSNIMKN